MSESTADLTNQFRDTARYLSRRLMPAPGLIPKIPGIEIQGMTIPYNGIAGGDVIIYVNFEERFDLDSRIRNAREQGEEKKAERLRQLRHKGGILVADVAGHDFTDAARALMFSQAFQMGALYEMDLNGEITTRLFEQINTRFCKSVTARNLAAGHDDSTFITMIYGEITDTGRFRFVNGGHPSPLVFSLEYDRFVDISPSRLVSFPPVGIQPLGDQPDVTRYQRALGYKKQYTVNELNLMGKGDILLVYTDGLIDPLSEYSKERLERCVSAAARSTAREICAAVIDDRQRAFELTDDLSLLVIRYS
jgi:serine phosphatase RsbU (regulator of sigma subunit)